MNRTQTTGLFMLGVLALSLAAPSARAENHFPPFVGSRPFFRLVPPRPSSLPGALIDQDLQLMRATSADPERFLFGQFNPRFELVNPSPVLIIPPFYGGYPYYGGAYNPYLYAGYGYPQYPYSPPVVQRQVVIIREAPPNRPTRENGDAKEGDEVRPKPSGEEFYLQERREDREGESISAALDDLRKAWLNGDFERIKVRFQTGSKIRIFLKGHYQYSVDSRDFAAMVKDAMTRLDTMAFEFDRPKPLEPGRAFVTGKHTWLDPAKTKHETYISYGLERIDGRWKIVEAGSSSTPIPKHEQ